MGEDFRDRLKRLYAGEEDPYMEEERREMLAMSAVLKMSAREDAARGIKPFLADRVMRRLAAERRAPEEELWLGLVWIFRPVAAVCLLLALFLTIHNVYLSRQYVTPVSTVEAVLALPEINTVTAYELDFTTYEDSVEP